MLEPVRTTLSHSSANDNILIRMGRSNIILLTFLALIGIASYGISLMPRSEPVVQACTQEAEICPDGSSVGRTGPNCEFATCPVATTSTATTTATTTAPTPTIPSAGGPITIKTGIGTTVSGLGVTITPLSILSDSRCPQDVQCVWAGTVELKAKILSASTESTMTLKLGEPVMTSGEQIVLLEVAPAKTSKTDIATSSYMFTFGVKKR